MLMKPLDAISREDVQSLVDNAASETVTREFKSQIAWESPSDRKELVTDISAIANAGGGDIWFGVREENGVAIEAVGIEIENPDELIRGIEQAVRDGTDPSIIGLRWKPIVGFDRGPVLLLRIPRTWNEPHMLTLKDSHRFWMRDTGSRHPMSTRELREAFLRADSPAEAARRFREERLSAIRRNDGASPLLAGPRLVIHVLPMAAFDLTDRLNITPWLREPAFRNAIQDIRSGGRYNVDGYIATRLRTGGENPYFYFQVFRTGPIEIVEIFADERPGPILPIEALERDILEYVTQAIKLLEAIHIGAPYVVMNTLLGVRGYTLSPKPENAETIDRDDVVMPPVIMDELIEGDVLDMALSDALDVLWNALGQKERMAYAFPRFVPWRKARRTGSPG